MIQAGLILAAALAGVGGEDRVVRLVLRARAGEVRTQNQRHTVELTEPGGKIIAREEKSESCSVESMARPPPPCNKPKRHSRISSRGEPGGRLSLSSEAMTKSWKKCDREAYPMVRAWGKRSRLRSHPSVATGTACVMAAST